MSSQSLRLSHCREQLLVRVSRDGWHRPETSAELCSSVPYGHYCGLTLEPKGVSPGEGGSSASTPSQALRSFAAAWVSVPGTHGPPSGGSRSSPPGRCTLPCPWRAVLHRLVRAGCGHRPSQLPTWCLKPATQEIFTAQKSVHAASQDPAPRLRAGGWLLPAHLPPHRLPVSGLGGVLSLCPASQTPFPGTTRPLCSEPRLEKTHPLLVALGQIPGGRLALWREGGAASPFGFCHVLLRPHLRHGALVPAE